MRRKVLAGLLLLSMTASSFATFGYVPVHAAEYEDDAVVADAVVSEEAAEESEQNVETEEDIVSSGDILYSGTYDTWSWSLDADGVFLIEGTDIKLGNLSDWPWRENRYGEIIKEAKVTGSGSGDLSNMFTGCTVMTSLDLSEFSTDNATKMDSMFWCCYELTDLDVSKFNTSNVTSMDSMFAFCSSLTDLDVSNFDTSKVTDMGCMFWGCSSLTDLDVSNFDTSNVESMFAMFRNCSSLTSLDVSGFNTANVLDLGSLFSGCSSLEYEDLSELNTGSATDISNMFFGCTGLTGVNLSSFDTSNVNTMQYMFYNCSSLADLDISNFDAGNTTSMDYMLYNCSSLTQIKSPYNISVKAELPTGITWVDGSGNTVKTMYQDREESVTYTKKDGQQTTLTYYIRFEGNGATNGSMSVRIYEAGQTYHLPANTFTRTGFLFNGWNTEANGSGNFYMDEDEIWNEVAEDKGVMVLYAQWIPISYTIHFDKNGATSGSMSRIYPKYGRYYRLPACGFSKPGYAMTGWNTKKDGTGTTYKNCSNVKNLTTENGGLIILYAQWKQVTVPTVSKPTLGNYVAGRLTVKYNEVPGAAGYLVQYSTNKNMTGAKNVSCTGTTKNIYGLKKGTTYYVRVRAYKVDSAGKKVYGKYSAIQYKKLTK